MGSTSLYIKYFLSLEAKDWARKKKEMTVGRKMHESKGHCKTKLTLFCVILIRESHARIKILENGRG